VLGYRFGPVAYLTDCSVIPEATKDLLRGLEVLVLGALRYRPHPTHMNFEEALRVVDELRPSRTYFTHLTHDIDYEEATAALPPNVSLAIDGLVISI
jgi:phosphoribosyl 1,2-cyclic phosphate phosphodiesterase